VIEKEKMDAAKEAAGEYPVFDILPYHQKKSVLSQPEVRSEKA
jgi:hypothetical protein